MAKLLENIGIQTERFCWAPLLVGIVLFFGLEGPESLGAIVWGMIGTIVLFFAPRAVAFIALCIYSMLS